MNLTSNFDIIGTWSSKFKLAFSRKRYEILEIEAATVVYTEHCSVWSYQFYWYYYRQYYADADEKVYADEKGRFLRWPDGAIRKISFN